MTPTGARPRAVLFDLDNTLTHRRSTIEAYGALFARDFATRLADAPIVDVAALIAHHDNGGYLRPDAQFDTVRGEVSNALVTHLRWAQPPTPAEIVEHWKARFFGLAVEMPGAGATLDRLVAAGLRVGIVSNGLDATRRAVVATLGFDRCAHALVSSGRAGVKKPDTRIFELAARELGVAASDCWFVGDHPVNDIDGATRAGMRAIWLEGFHGWPEAQPRVTTIDALAQLEGLMPA